VAYAVQRCAPITATRNADGSGPPVNRPGAPGSSATGTGLDAEGRTAPVDAVTARLHALVDFVHAQDDVGSAAVAGRLAAGHHRQHLGDAATHLTAQRALFEGHVTAY
jgi:hypothetical protein